MKGEKYASPGGDYPCPNSLEGSTKNVGGDRKGSGPTAQNDPFGYLDVSGPEYEYLGHFKKEEYLEEGHNENRMRPVTLDTSGGAGAPSLSVGRRSFVGQAMERGAERLGRRAAMRTIAAGGDVGARIASSRPVLAARVAAREAGVTGAARRAAVAEARKSPEALRNERRMKGGRALARY